MKLIEDYNEFKNIFRNKMNTLIPTTKNATSFEPLNHAFCYGIVLALSGKLQFDTDDTGLVASTGNGTGNGIKGINVPRLKESFRTKSRDLFKSEGTDLITVSHVMAESVREYFEKYAFFQSDHTPVFQGTGTIKKYYGVTKEEVASKIQSLTDFTGVDWGNWCLAIGDALISELAQPELTGEVSITGTPPPFPVPGGSGTGKGKVY